MSTESSKGEVTETCFANIAIKDKDERWITPPLTSGLLAGLLETKSEINQKQAPKEDNC